MKVKFANIEVIEKLQMKKKEKDSISLQKLHEMISYMPQD